MTALRNDRRALLLEAVLRVHVREGWGVDTAEVSPFPAGAGMVDRASSQGWALIDEAKIERDALDPGSRGEGAAKPRGWLGGAVSFLLRSGVSTGHVLLANPSADDARRAQLFALRPRVWRFEGRERHQVVPAPFLPVPDPSVDVLAFAGIIEAAGAVAVVEFGVLRAEMLGLEVGRVVHSPDDGSPFLEVGVGRHDRLANQLMRADVDSGEALRRVVEAVRAQRCAGAGVHPANQLSRARWLRSVVCLHPELVGASELEPISATVEGGFRQPPPAMALGRDVHGRPLMVAFSVGLDLDAPVYAADAFVAFAPSDSGLVVCVPVGDDQPVIRRLCAALESPAELVTVPSEWAALS